VSLLAEKNVFITGASSGIGEACARAFAEEGAHLWLCARRLDRLNTLAEDLKAKFDAKVQTFALDVRDAKAVSEACATLPCVDVLLNNAGLSRGLVSVEEGLLSDWDEMIETNVKGLLHVSRAVLPAMVKAGEGHVIHIGSIAGREVYPGGAVYCGTKYAVKAIAEGMRVDLCGTGVRVSCVDPGLVNTEFSRVRFHGDQTKADVAYQGMTPLSGEDVAESVLWVASRPPHVNVGDLLLLPTDQASAQRVHRRLS